MFDSNITDATGWTALLLGLFILFAAIGALRRPGIWQTMVGDFEKSPALQLTASLIELLTGTAVYLLNPWLPADPATCIMKGLGGLMIIEALVVVGFSDAYFHFWLRTFNFTNRGCAVLTLIVGVLMIGLGAMRFS